MSKIPKKQLIEAALGMKSKDREDLAEKLLESLKESDRDGGASAEIIDTDGGPTLKRLKEIARAIEAQSDADPRPDIPAERVHARLRKKYP